MHVRTVILSALIVTIFAAPGPVASAGRSSRPSVTPARAHAGHVRRPTNRQRLNTRTNSRAIELRTDPASLRGDRRAIDVQVRAHDPGLQVTMGKNSVTITGTAKGLGVYRDIFNMPVAERHGSVRVSLDLGKATSIADKNARGFVVSTGKGATAATLARHLANQINKPNPPSMFFPFLPRARLFRASVAVDEASNSATVTFDKVAAR